MKDSYFSNSKINKMQIQQIFKKNCEENRDKNNLFITKLVVYNPL